MPTTRPIAISQPSLDHDEWEELRGPLDSGWLTQGPKVAAFERAFAERHGVTHAVATSSCTTALHLILVAMGIGPGDEVIVPAFTWVATANVVVHCGAVPVLADIDPITFNLDPSAVAKAVTPRTRAVIVVHLFGRCAEMEAIAAAAHGIPLIEDAACAVGASHCGVSAGGLGLAAAFSFHPRKTITTGEGGMITTRDPDLAGRVAILRNHGAAMSEEERHHGPRPYLLPDFNVLGFNYRMTDLQGAVGLAQLRKLDGFLAERRAAARNLCAELANLDGIIPPSLDDCGENGWQAFVCKIDEQRAPCPRNSIMEQLQAAGIASRPGTHALHLLGLYRDMFGFRPEDFPAALDADRRSLALPLHNRMTTADYARVVECLKGMWGTRRIL